MINIKKVLNKEETYVQITPEPLIEIENFYRCIHRVYNEYNDSVFLQMKNHKIHIGRPKYTRRSKQKKLLVYVLVQLDGKRVRHKITEIYF